MPRVKTEEEKQKKGWRELHHIEMLYYIAEKMDLRKDITAAGIRRAVNSLSYGYLCRVTSEFTSWEDDEEWIRFHLTPSSVPSLNKRVYRIDICRIALFRLGLDDKVKDLQMVAEELCKDNRRAYDQRLNYGKKLTSFNKDRLWLRERVRKFFETPKYKAYLIDAPKHEI
ncbi:hypothetical protein ISS03_01810 [Patescibacteria group bacterium]|nr:hypothetical protein [Patescibacteria group bacterium]